MQDKNPLEQPAAIDRSVLIDAMGGNEKIALELLLNFRKSLPARVEKLKAALAAGDIQAIGAASHQFKGAAAMIGANALAAICAQIEAAAETGDTAQINVLAEIFDEQAARATEQLAVL